MYVDREWCVPTSSRLMLCTVGCIYDMVLYMSYGLIYESIVQSPLTTVLCTGTVL